MNSFIVQFLPVSWLHDDLQSDNVTPYIQIHTQFTHYYLHIPLCIYDPTLHITHVSLPVTTLMQLNTTVCIPHVERSVFNFG